MSEIDWKGFEEDRKRLEKESKNIKNLLDYMRASASIGQIYDYIEAWEEELTKWVKVLEMNNSKDPHALILNIVLGKKQEKEKQKHD